MNKSIRIIAMAAMVLLAVSCKKQEGTNKVRLEASIESPSGKAYTTLISPVSVWESGDQIIVNDNLMDLKSMNEDHDKGYFECDNWKGDIPDGTTALYAIYPATEQIENPKVEKGWKSRVTVPSRQDYFDASINKLQVPMGISSVSNKLELHNLVNVYAIPVIADEDGLVITKVEIEKALEPVDKFHVASEEYIDDLQIAADIWYPHYGSETADIDIIGDASYTIELNCKVDGYQNGVSISETTPTYFYFIAWPVQLGNGLKLRFYDENGLICSRIKPIVSKIDYNRIYELRDSSEDGNSPKPFVIKHD